MNMVTVNTRKFAMAMPEVDEEFSLTREEFHQFMIDMKDCQPPAIFYLEYCWPEEGTPVLGWHLFSSKEEWVSRGSPDWLFKKAGTERARQLREEIRLAAGDNENFFPSEKELGWD